MQAARLSFMVNAKVQQAYLLPSSCLICSPCWLSCMRAAGLSLLAHPELHCMRGAVAERVCAAAKRDASRR